jgi:hypothetical protein
MTFRLRSERTTTMLRRRLLLSQFGSLLVFRLKVFGVMAGNRGMRWLPIFSMETRDRRFWRRPHCRSLPPPCWSVVLHLLLDPIPCAFFACLRRLIRLSLSAESAAIQQCFSLTANQRTVLSATINQRAHQLDRSMVGGRRS